jgi:hypothetical protein
VTEQLHALTEQLNTHCFCLSVDADELRRSLENSPGLAGVYADILRDQPHLFSRSPVFVAGGHLQRMGEAVAAIEAVIALPAFGRLALGQAPAIARTADASAGVFLGYDFHLGAAGPQLIEINTNAGGALLNTALARAQKACCREVEASVAAAPAAGDLQGRFVEMFRREHALAARGGAGARLERIAIVDDAPTTQYLYPEFRMFAELFARHGIEATILDPRELEHRDGGLRGAGRPIDLVYNRSCDFHFDEPASAALASAWTAGDVVVTPNPRTHALYADKRHLALLSDPQALAALGADAATIATVTSAVPTTVAVTAANAEALWSERRAWFFKPATGFGSRAAYRGDKLTRKVWDQIRTRAYVAQRLVPPSRRTIRTDAGEIPLKLDLRAYVYAGEVQLVAARLYEGQTTNFRTAGGGFAPVFTEAGVVSPAG